MSTPSTDQLADLGDAVNRLAATVDPMPGQLAAVSADLRATIALLEADATRPMPAAPAPAAPAAERARRSATAPVALALAVLALVVALAGSSRATAEPAPAAPPSTSMSAAQVCRLALVAEHARWRIDPDTYSAPRECDQPLVTWDEYAAAWAAVGAGLVWDDIAPKTHEQQ